MTLREEWLTAKAHGRVLVTLDEQSVRGFTSSDKSDDGELFGLRISTLLVEADPKRQQLILSGETTGRYQSFGVREMQIKFGPVSEADALAWGEAVHAARTGLPVEPSAAQPAVEETSADAEPASRSATSCLTVEVAPAGKLPPMLATMSEPQAAVRLQAALRGKVARARAARTEDEDELPVAEAVLLENTTSTSTPVAQMEMEVARDDRRSDSMAELSVQALEHLLSHEAVAPLGQLLSRSSGDSGEMDQANQTAAVVTAEAAATTTAAAGHAAGRAAVVGSSAAEPSIVFESGDEGGQEGGSARGAACDPRALTPRGGTMLERQQMRTSYPQLESAAAAAAVGAGAGAGAAGVEPRMVTGMLRKKGSQFPYSWQTRYFVYAPQTRSLRYYKTAKDAPPPAGDHAGDVPARGSVGAAATAAELKGQLQLADVSTGACLSKDGKERKDAAALTFVGVDGRELTARARSGSEAAMWARRLQATMGHDRSSARSSGASAA